MKFRDKENDGFYKGRKKGFEFTIAIYRWPHSWYVVASHTKKDIRFNTLWSNITFPSMEKSIEFCKKFDYKKHSWLGSGV